MVVIVLDQRGKRRKEERREVGCQVEQIIRWNNFTVGWVLIIREPGRLLRQEVAENRYVEIESKEREL